MPVSMFGDSPRNRIILWSAHQVAWFWALMFADTVADDVFPGNTTLKILTNVSVVGILWMIYAHHRHGLVLCPLCADAVPLDGPGRAATRATALLWAHRVFTRRYIVFEAVGATVAYVVSSTVLKHVSLVVYWICGLSAIEAYLIRVHQPLQPWCPHCHWDDDGDHEVLPDPVPPSGAVVRT